MSKKHFWGFAALETSYWCFHASFICYASAFFLENGIGNTVVSLLLAGFMLCSFIGSIIWGAICDALGTNKKVFLVGLMVSAALMYFIYANVSNVTLMAIAYPLLGFFFLPQSANADAWLLSACDHDQKTYGQIRCTPSLVYAFWAAAMGRLIGANGYSMMLLGGTAFAVVVILAALYLSDTAAAPRHGAGMSKDELVGLYKNEKYRRMVLLLLLVGLTVAPVNNLKIVVMESVGGDVTHVGIDSFASAITQVPFFLLAGWLQRVPLRIRYAAMTGLPVVMIALCMTAASPAMVILASVIYNVAFGILMPTMREVTEKYVQRSLRNLGHNLSDAVFNSFSAVVSLTYAGVIVDGWGVNAMLAVSMTIALSAFVLSLVMGRHE